MNKIFRILLNAFLMVMCLAAAAFAQSPKRILIIGQQKETIEHYVKGIGVPDGFMVYTSIQDMEGLETPSDKGAGIQYAQYYVTHYPKAVIQLAVYMNGALQDVTAGQYDRNILHLARWIKQSKREIYLRLGYEFDLPNNQYDPELYKKAFRYIVDRLRAQELDQVHYVWHSAAMINSALDFMNWYPGDHYVDWFAVSFFNPLQAKTAETFFALAREHHKPLMIAESTPAGLYTLRGRKDWFKKYFDFIRRHEIKIISYIDSKWDKYPLFEQGNWGDARVEKDPEIKELWLQFLKEIQEGGTSRARVFIVPD